MLLTRLGGVAGVWAMFWDGFIAVVIIGVILSLIGAVLVMTLGKRYPFVRYLAYVIIGYVALLVLTSPFTIAARYESTETLTGTHPGCNSHRFEVIGESLAGNEVFSLASITDWCFDGSEITRSPFFRSGVSTPTIFWSFEGILDKRSNGGQGEWSHSDFVQGKFNYCPMFVGCVQYAYPTVVKHQYRDGTATAEHYE